MGDDRISLEIVLCREQGRWFAHALQFGLLGDGGSQVEAVNMMFEAIELQWRASCEMGNRDIPFSPAEQKFFEMFERGREAVIALEIPFSCHKVIRSATARESLTDAIADAASEPVLPCEPGSVGGA
jgi:hypothetical protein